MFDVVKRTRELNSSLNEDFQRIFSPAVDFDILECGMETVLELGGKALKNSIDINSKKHTHKETFKPNSKV